MSGTVIVTPPGKKAFKLGTQDQNIPIGSLLDTTHGRVDLAAAAQAARRARPHRVLRLLGASGHGRFQTRGRYAAATVRGTVWTTTDYCDGTLVRVQRGVVSVQDFVRHRTLAVAVGHSYFAKAP